MAQNTKIQVRPFDLAWADSMRKESEEAGVPYFFKQIDGVQPIPEKYDLKQFPL
jgi:protein gp37